MEELINKSVMVNPLLTDDPIRMQGQVGLIDSIDLEKDEIMVKFPNNAIGAYSADALLCLQPKEMVLDTIKAKLVELDPKDVRILLDIYRLQNVGEPVAFEEAYRWAIAFENVANNSLVSLEDYLSLGLSDNIELQNSRGR
ncbi:hypothetical protein ACQKCH_15270 [Nubsella zeaxanthinifaciens]|jgi:hypothetical protein|uniref:hypothetical protein n=1 Tax=Nubsella zeaxanthinifaciens TaxID=392412 RepID=UPI003D086907